MQAYATVLSALIGATFGSLIVAWAAWKRYRYERGYDHRLEWYVSMVRAINTFTQKVEIALTWQAEDEKTSAELVSQSWREAQKAQLALERECLEAPLFASTVAMHGAFEIATFVQTISNCSGGFDPNSLPRGKRKQAIELISSVPDKLREFLGPLAQEGRRHLGVR